LQSITNCNEKRGYCRVTARRATSIATLSTAAQLYEKSHVHDFQGHSRSSEMARFDVLCHFVYSVVRTSLSCTI